MTNKIYFSFSITSKILTTEKCFKFFINSISFIILFLYFSSLKVVLLNDLIATILPVKICKPIFTLPKAPFPITRPNL